MLKPKQLLTIKSDKGSSHTTQFKCYPKGKGRLDQFLNNRLTGLELPCFLSCHVFYLLETKWTRCLYSCMLHLNKTYSDLRNEKFLVHCTVNEEIKGNNLCFPNNQAQQEMKYSWENKVFHSLTFHCQPLIENRLKRTCMSTSNEKLFDKSVSRDSKKGLKQVISVQTQCTSTSLVHCVV